MPQCGSHSPLVINAVYIAASAYLSRSESRKLPNGVVFCVRRAVAPSRASQYPDSIRRIAAVRMYALFVFHCV